MVARYDMKCPVCKTECHNKSECPECGFDDLNPTFFSKEEGEEWQEQVVWPWRKRYWEALDDFVIEGTKLVKYVGSERKVSIPYGIQTLGKKCMAGNLTLLTIDIPNSVTIIEDRAFEFCFELQEVHIPGTVCAIGMHAFSGTKITDIILPESIEIITAHSLPKNMLKSIHIPAKVKEVDPGVIGGSKLESITVDRNNPYFFVEQGCLIDAQNQAVIATGINSEMPISTKITQIGAYAFSSRNVSEVVIPEGVTRIEDGAFACCFNMERIRFPSTLEYIGVGILQNCYNLIEINVHSANPYYFCDNGCLIDRRNAEIIFCFSKKKKYVFPEYAKSIAPYAYHGEKCEGQIVILGSKMKTIRKNAFSSSDNIHLLIPENVQIIEPKAIRITGRIFCEQAIKPSTWAENWCITTGDHFWQVFSEVHWIDSWHYEGDIPIVNNYTPSLLYY